MQKSCQRLEMQIPKENTYTGLNKRIRRIPI